MPRPRWMARRRRPGRGCVRRAGKGVRRRCRSLCWGWPARCSRSVRRIAPPACWMRRSPAARRCPAGRLCRSLALLRARRSASRRARRLRRRRRGPAPAAQRRADAAAACRAGVAAAAGTPANLPPSWWTGWRRWTGCSPAGCRPRRWRWRGRCWSLSRRSGQTRRRAGARLCGLLVPLAWPLPASAPRPPSRRQFLALTRLQARFLDRVRGIATIVLAGRAEDEAAALAAAADELRRRTMRVLRVAFLSSAALDLAAARGAGGARDALRLSAAAAAPLARRRRRRCSCCCWCRSSSPRCASIAAAYQDRLHATAAAEALVELPPVPDAGAAALPVRTVAARGVTVAFEDVRLTWDPARGPALDGLSASACRPARRWCWPGRPAPASRR